MPLDKDGYDKAYSSQRQARNAIRGATWPAVLNRKSKLVCLICAATGLGRLIPTSELDKFTCRSYGKVYTIKPKPQNDNNKTMKGRVTIHTTDEIEQTLEEDMNDIKSGLRLN